MFCSICKHSERAKIVEDWAYSRSLRETALKYGVGYRSLQRHLDLCIPSIYSERENREYESAFKQNAEWLRYYFKTKMRKPRRKSIIKKAVEFSWSRRSWKKSKK